jgi:ATP-GRASP peptide maturase of grasp-with-spasm system
MILIVSEEKDHTTNDVIDWLFSWQKPFLRINETDVINVKEIVINQKKTDIFFSVNKEKTIYSIKKFTAYWYRRGNIKLSISFINKDFEISKEINNYLNLENSRLEHFFISQLNKIPNRIGSVFELNNNKLNNLIIAKEVGLLIPDAKIITTSEQLNLATKNKQYISKAIYNNFSIFNLNYHISSYTQLVNLKNKSKTNYFPSLIQEFIVKKVDVRVFYLRKKIWAVALISQNNQNTKIDCRHSSENDLSMRMELINLPLKINKKIIQLMQIINMDSGSLDFVISEKNDYYFLEINPVGHFGFMSSVCGFNLEFEIANELIK